MITISIADAAAKYGGTTLREVIENLIRSGEFYKIWLYGEPSTGNRERTSTYDPETNTVNVAYAEPPSRRTRTHLLCASESDSATTTGRFLMTEVANETRIYYQGKLEASLDDEYFDQPIGIDTNAATESDVPQNAIRAIDLLVELCTRNDILSPGELLIEAKEHLRAAGDEGSRALAQLIVELLESRSRGLSWAVVAAEECKPTGELLQALQSVMSAEPLKSGTKGRFTPEIFGDGKIGWTDATHERIKSQANQALEALKND